MLNWGPRELRKNEKENNYVHFVKLLNINAKTEFKF